MEHVPEWEKPCWIVALTRTLGVSESRVKSAARSNGWDSKSSGLPLSTVISVAWDFLGYQPDLSLTKAASSYTVRRLSASHIVNGKTGIVFTKSHVMPLVDGHLSNFNGHGDEMVVVVAIFQPKSRVMKDLQEQIKAASLRVQASSQPVVASDEDFESRMDTLLENLETGLFATELIRKKGNSVELFAHNGFSDGARSSFKELLDDLGQLHKALTSEGFGDAEVSLVTKTVPDVGRATGISILINNFK